MITKHPNWLKACQRMGGWFWTIVAIRKARKKLAERRVEFGDIVGETLVPYDSGCYTTRIWM